MAVHSNHPASAPPAPPVREKTGHLMLRGWCIFVMFLALSGTAWVHAFGQLVASSVAIGSGVLTVILWIVVRPPVQWRRLPWYVVSFVAWATLSLLWSAWPQTTALTLLLLWITTIQALFVGSTLTWRELVRAAASHVNNRGTDAIGPHFVLGQAAANDLLGRGEKLGFVFSSAADTDEYLGAGTRERSGGSSPANRPTDRQRPVTVPVSCADGAGLARGVWYGDPELQRL